MYTVLRLHCEHTRMPLPLYQVKDRLPGQQLKAVIPCFLVQEGSEMFKTNKKGRNPLEVCSPDVATIVMGFDKDG